MGTKTCPSCGGSGNPSVAGERSSGCMSCGGQGWVYTTDESPDYDSSSLTSSGDTSYVGSAPAPRTPEPSPKPSRSASQTGSAGDASTGGKADGFFAVAGFLVGGGYVYSSTNEPIAGLIAGAIAGFVAMKTWRIALVLGAVAIGVAAFKDGSQAPRPPALAQPVIAEPVSPTEPSAAPAVTSPPTQAETPAQTQISAAVEPAPPPPSPAPTPSPQTQPFDHERRRQNLLQMRDEILAADQTPLISIDASGDGFELLRQYVSKDGELILDVSTSAVRDLEFESNKLAFIAGFNGEAIELAIPYERIRAIYAKETGKGWDFRK